MPAMPSEPAERRLQRVEPERAQVQRVAVECLQIERGTLARLRVLARLEPDAFADLVCRRLSGPAEVAVELEAKVLVRDAAVCAQELPTEVGRPTLARPPAERVVPRHLELEVHADVHDDA